MKDVGPIVVGLLVLCMSAVVGLSSAHRSRANSHYKHLLYGHRTQDAQMVVSEYHHLPKSLKEFPRIQRMYEEAMAVVHDKPSLDLFPTTEKRDCIAFGVFALCMLGLYVCSRPKERKLYSKKDEKSAPPPPTEGQVKFIRRINNGILPPHLTKDSAAVMIKDYLARVSAIQRRQRIDISPLQFMSPSQARRKKLRIERERKRAADKLAREKAQEERRKQREEQKQRKDEDRLYNKRIAEEEKLIKAREDAQSGTAHKARTEKARVIQELQNLVNDILADKKIEPQEVRQLKAWLLANRTSDAEFAPMIKVIDDSLVDGVIDADETQAIYEGVIDCLITLRERSSR